MSSSLCPTILERHVEIASGYRRMGAILRVPNEGHGVGIDDAKDDLLRYFQQIDRGLHALLHEERTPLVLAAVKYLQPIYRQANSYAHLEKQGIDGNPDRWCSKECQDFLPSSPEFGSTRLLKTL